jgi:hypothetical protein
MDTRRVDDYIGRLKNELKFLEQLLEERPEGKQHYLKKDIMALKWVIRFAEDNVLLAAEHQTKWFNELGEKE